MAQAQGQIAQAHQSHHVNTRKRAVVLISGGLDSSTLAFLLASQRESAPALREELLLDPDGYDVHLLSVHYGQRHHKELEAAASIARTLDARYDVVDLSVLRCLLTGSALTDDRVNMPHGHYAAPSMALTVVPNRNAILLSIAFAVAVAEKADLVVAGFHSGDHPIYPDCRPEFVSSFDAMERLATEGYASPELRLSAPFVQVGKEHIVSLGACLDVPFATTWSCYEGGDLHCGQCGTCVERQQAFALAGIPDPTGYAAALREGE